MSTGLRLLRCGSVFQRTSPLAPASFSGRVGVATALWYRVTGQTRIIALFAMDPDCESHRLSNVSLDFRFFDPALVCYLICRHFKIAVSPAQTAKFDESSSNTFAGKDQLLEAQHASPVIPLHREFRSFAFVQQSDCMPCRWKVALTGSLAVILASPMVLRKAWQRKVGQPSLPLLNQGRINGQRPGKPLETVQDPCSLQGRSPESFVDSPMPTDCVNLNLQVAFQAIVVRSEFVFCFTASTLQPQLTSGAGPRFQQDRSIDYGLN